MSYSAQNIIDKWKKILPVPVTEGNQVDYLIDGTATYAAMYNAIGTTLTTTKDSGFYIYILGWWLDDTLPLILGNPQSTIEQLLIKAACSNVQIRVILWDNLFQKLSPQLVGSFNRDTVKHVQQLKSGVGLLDKHPLSISGSHHQKIIVVKGSIGIIGFCGGIDISRDRIMRVSLHKGSPYHDVHCRIQGDGARGLLAVFIQRWMQHPDHSKWDLPYKQGGKGVLIGLDDIKGTNEKTTGNQLVAIGRTFNRKVNGKGCASDRSVFDILRNAINASTNFIYIEDQYMVSIRLADLLQKQLHKLKHLLIVIPHSDLSDLPNVKAARARFANALKKDKKAYEEKVAIFYRVHANLKTPKADGTYIHAKTWIFDDELAVIGSANVNERGISYDSEAIAAIFDKDASINGDPSFAQALRDKLWKEHLGIPSNSRAVLDASSDSSWQFWASVSKSTKGATVLKYDGIDSPDPGPVDTKPATIKRVGFNNVEDSTFSSIPSFMDSFYDAFADLDKAVNLGKCSK
jgi:phosphatidylserine/phosphatidylglycerophosphate/cardiolipin synthase-like enzyme